ncbi:MFS multidrug transporter [Aspergillus piperis CBS 112811]|uniref:MFS multidrug transporter n=1 Tax=Aspergillus piperis CBS 112811 TaxID=1448313 RepID=A0A8G1QVR0_9EURO|nr:MFS multidrug transporter [Aspergillus piperis CBS 112811]RAH55271.1 MFS multidrug transporter [Aspergillus piperis CBS 112811]
MSPSSKSEDGNSALVHANFEEEGQINTTTNVALDWKAGRAEHATILVLATISVLTAFNSTAFPSTISVIAQDLHAGATASFWGQTAYLLPSASLQPVMCSLSEVYGRKSVLLISLLFFAAGAVGPAVAESVGPFIAGRAVQGIGGAGLLSLPKVITTDIFPLRQRPKYTSLLQIASALGMMLGPVSGGALAQNIHEGWRWIFYITFPVCAGAFLTICLFLRAAGLAFTLLWAHWDQSSTVLRNHSSLASYLASIIQGIMSCMQLSGTLYACSLYLEGIKRYSPLVTGAILLAMLGTMIPSALAASLLMTRLGSLRSSAAGSIGKLIAVGAGHGVLLNSLLFAAQAVVPGKDAAYATAIFTTTRALGFTLGVVIEGTLLQNFITNSLADSDVAARIAENVTSYVAALQMNSPLPVQRRIVEEALIYAFRWVFVVLTIIGGAGLVCTVAIATRNMDRPLESNHRLEASRAQPQS